MTLEERDHRSNTLFTTSRSELDGKCIRGAARSVFQSQSACLFNPGLLSGASQGGMFRDRAANWI